MKKNRNRARRNRPTNNNKKEEKNSSSFCIQKAKTKVRDDKKRQMKNEAESWAWPEISKLIRNLFIA